MRRTLTALLFLALVACADGQADPAPRQTDERGVGEHLRMDRPRAPQLATLTFTIESGTCSQSSRPRLSGVAVDEQAKTVTVTAKVFHPKASKADGGICGGVGVSIPVAVTLERPLGDRRVLDGSCSPPEEVIEVDEDRQPCTPTERALAEEDAVGTWAPMDAGPLAPRGEPKGVWTGNRLIVVSGIDIPRYAPFADGASYDPTTDKWTRIAPRPDPGRALAVAWTGKEMFALGTTAGYELDRPQSAHLYNPKTDTWRPASVPRHFGQLNVFWTGSEILVWDEIGGQLFDPITNTWREIPPMTMQGGSIGASAEWSDASRELAVLGGFDPMNGDPGNVAVFLFAPATGKWRRAADAPVKLGSRSFTYAAMVGDEELFTEASVDAARTVAYDAGRDRWRKLPSFDRGDGMTYSQSVFIGNQRGVMWTGNDARPLQMIDLDRARWAHAAAPGPMPGPGGAMVWTGREVLLFGGPLMWDQDARNRAWRWTPPA